MKHLITFLVSITLGVTIGYMLHPFLFPNPVIDGSVPSIPDLHLDRAVDSKALAILLGTSLALFIGAFITLIRSSFKSIPSLVMNLFGGAFFVWSSMQIQSQIDTIAAFVESHPSSEMTQSKLTAAWEPEFLIYIITAVIALLLFSVIRYVGQTLADERAEIDHQGSQSN